MFVRHEGCLTFLGPLHDVKGRHFDCSVILLCVRWYLAYSLNLRDLKEMIAQRHSAIYR